MTSYTFHVLYKPNNIIKTIGCFVNLKQYTSSLCLNHTGKISSDSMVSNIRHNDGTSIDRRKIGFSLFFYLFYDIAEYIHIYTTIFYCDMQYFLQPFYINGEISKMHVKMTNWVNFASKLFNFSLNCPHCTERKVREDRYWHEDCKTSHYEHLNTCISV